MSSNKAQNMSVPTLLSFSQEKQNKIKIQLQHTEILNYLILIAVIIYFVNSLNRFESLLINQENSNFVT